MGIIYSVLESIGFNWHVALANFINFLIILFVLNKFVFKKVVNLVEDREKKIKDGLSNASNAELALKNATQKGEELVFDAKNAGEEILRKALDKSKLESEEIVARSKQDAENLANSLKTKIQEAKENVTKEFAEYAPSLVADLLKKTLAKSLTKEEHDLIILNLVKK